MGKKRLLAIIVAISAALIFTPSASTLADEDIGVYIPPVEQDGQGVAPPTSVAGGSNSSTPAAVGPADEDATTLPAVDTQADSVVSSAAAVNCENDVGKESAEVVDFYGDPDTVASRTEIVLIMALLQK